MPRSDSPTINDIARVSSVSKATVSRVLNNSPSVASETRSRVLHAIDSLDFRANRAAQSLRTSKSALVGLLVPAIDHDVFARVAERLDADLGDLGIGLMITSSQWDPRRDLRALEALCARSVDALIVSLADDRDPDVCAYLRSVDCPLVLLDREVRGLSCDAVLTEQRQGLTEAIEHLASLGHTRIGLVTMTQNTRPGRELAAAYQSALSQMGLTYAPDLVIPCARFDRDVGSAAVDRLLANGVTAIISVGPMMIIAGILQRLDDLGRRIPDDVSIVTYDENELASAKRPRLTVVSRPIDDMARLASQLVMARLTTPTGSRQVGVVRMRLHVRESTGPVGNQPGDARRRQRFPIGTTVPHRSVG